VNSEAPSGVIIPAAISPSNSRAGNVIGTFPTTAGETMSHTAGRVRSAPVFGRCPY
jgi:hypothetical protein